MRSHIYCRIARETEARVFFEWAMANGERNDFDPMVVTYENTITACAFDEDGPLAFLPLQQPLLVDAESKPRPVAETPMFLEGMAFRPGISKLDTSRVMKELLQFAVSLGFLKGTGEIYFLGSDEGTDTLAANQIFKRLPHTVYRLRLSDLEKKTCA